MDIIINAAWTVILVILGIMSVLEGENEFGIISAFLIWILWKDDVAAIRRGKSADEEKNFKEKQAEIESFRKEYNEEKNEEV